MLGDDAIISSDFGGNPPYEKMKEVAPICFKHWLKQTNVLFIIGGKSNNTDIFETFRAMGDALREHFSAHGPTPLYVVVGRGGPNLVRGMGALGETCDASALPYRLFGFDCAMSEVVLYARNIDDWMRAGGRESIAARHRRQPPQAEGGVRRPGHSGAALLSRIVRSLGEIATRSDRVCVLNILGGESSEVTPVGHAFSGGNVVFGTSPGRRGQVLETPLGDIPVYNNVREGLDAGHRFNAGVVYLPPSGGARRRRRADPRQSAICRRSSSSPRRSSVHDAREIRALGQAARIDIFGGNCLGVADTWNRVRIGGALGGDHPDEALLQGLDRDLLQLRRLHDHDRALSATDGWGTTTLHLDRQGRLHPLCRARLRVSRSRPTTAQQGGRAVLSSRAAITSRRLDFGKPVVACVVGRWKSRLTRAVGHAGAMAGRATTRAPRSAGSWTRSASTRSFTPDDPVVLAPRARW